MQVEASSLRSGRAPLHPEEPPSGGVSKGPSCNESTSVQLGIRHCRRRRRNGSEHAPITREQLAAMGYASIDDMWKALKAEPNDRSKWEHVMRAPMRNNRLILLRPWLYHTAGPGFGDSLENGRLVYRIFFVAEGMVDYYKSQGYL